MDAKTKTARCWSGAEIWCRTCKGPTKDAGDDYGSLSDGGSYERFRCLDPQCKQPTMYIELPD